MPHGGPSARDEWGFDWLAQYFAQPRLCRAPAQLSRLVRLWRRLVPEERLPILADGDRRRQRRRPLARRPGHRRPGEAGDLRLVLWRLCGAAVRGGRSRLFKAVVAVAPVTDLASWSRIRRNFTNYRLVRNFIGTGPASARRLAGAECRQDQGAGAALPRRPGPQRRRSASRGRCRTGSRAPARRASSSSITASTTSSRTAAARADMLKRSDAFLRRSALKIQ